MSPIRTVDDYREVTFEAVELFNKKLYDEALAKFLEMRESNAKNVKIREMLVYIYLHMGRLDEAEAEYQILQDILKEEGGIFRKTRSFDEIVAEAGDVEKVEKDYKKMMKKYQPSNIFEETEVPMKLSFLYMAQGEFEKAEEVLVEFRDKYLAIAS